MTIQECFNSNGTRSSQLLSEHPGALEHCVSSAAPPVSSKEQPVSATARTNGAPALIPTAARNIANPVDSSHGRCGIELEYVSIFLLEKKVVDETDRDVAGERAV